MNEDIAARIEAAVKTIADEAADEVNARLDFVATLSASWCATGVRQDAAAAMAIGLSKQITDGFADATPATRADAFRRSCPLFAKMIAEQATKARR